jgi:hypothetical protein
MDPIVNQSLHCQAIVDRYRKRSCCNYARKGTISCYSHRKIETLEYEQQLIKNFVKDAIAKVIYESRQDCIRKHGWDKYCEKLAKRQI